VNGQLTIKPATLVDPTANLEIIQRPAYVSRGGEKLAAALSQFPITVSEKICADVGASTGGFTDCLLQNGALRVYAIDVGEGILHWKLRQDGRVVVMEKTNARFVERLPEPVGLLTIDASFISLKVLLPVVIHWLEPAADVVALIKPQFEAGRQETAKGDGVIRNPEIHRRVLLDVLEFAQVKNFAVNGLLRSPLLGPKGNVEFLAWLSLPQRDSCDVGALVSGVLP
jgi:23S rRNA (cytidine1920-2'-O)/16S rRNA (cytidine1409-2'-O)-methyltransferase